MIKQRFFYLLIYLLFTVLGCQTAGVSSPISTPSPPSPPDSASTVLSISWERDALSAYYRIRQYLSNEALESFELIDIQGRWIDSNLWGEWEYTFSHNHSLWIYNEQGLRLKQALDNTKPLPPSLPHPEIENLLQTLSAQLELNPPLLSEKHFAGVSWNPVSGWVYNTYKESIPE